MNEFWRRSVEVLNTSATIFPDSLMKVSIIWDDCIVEQLQLVPIFSRSEMIFENTFLSSIFITILTTFSQIYTSSNILTIFSQDDAALLRIHCKECNFCAEHTCFKPVVIPIMKNKSPASIPLHQWFSFCLSKISNHEWATNLQKFKNKLFLFSPQ